MISRKLWGIWRRLVAWLFPKKVNPQDLFEENWRASISEESMGRLSSSSLIISPYSHLIVDFECKSGHKWSSTIEAHYSAYLKSKYTGCPRCIAGRTLEDFVYEFVVEVAGEGERVERENQDTIINPETGSYLEMDIFLPDLSLAIEVNGDIWHSKRAYLHDKESGTCETRERLKEVLAKEKGILLVHVWGSEWERNAASIQRNLQEIIRIAKVLKENGKSIV